MLCIVAIWVVELFCGCRDCDLHRRLEKIVFKDDFLCCLVLNKKQVIAKYLAMVNLKCRMFSEFSSSVAVQLAGESES